MEEEVGDAYKMDAVQCTHPRRTRGSSSNTPCGDKGYIRREDSENSAAQYVYARGFTLVYFLSSFLSPSLREYLPRALLFLHFPLPQPLIHYVSLAEQSFLFPFPGLLSASLRIGGCGLDRTSLETTHVIAFNGTRKEQRCRETKLAHARISRRSIFLYRTNLPAIAKKKIRLRRYAGKWLSRNILLLTTILLLTSTSSNINLYFI